MRDMTSLETAYLEQTKKLAMLTAALGLCGDEPAHALAARARRIATDRLVLLTAAARLTEAAPGAVGTKALLELRAAVDAARQPEKV